MTTLCHQLTIKTSPEKLYERLCTEDGIGSWWDRPTINTTSGQTVLEFRPGPEHGVLKMKLLEQAPRNVVRWECISIHPAESPASAWTGTRITFEFTSRANDCVLNFRHDGWDENSKYLGFCNYQWAMALQKLKQSCEKI